MRLTAVRMNWQLLLRLFAAAATLTGLAVGSRSFVRRDFCAPAAGSGTAVANASNVAGSFAECAFRCSESGWCAALLMKAKPSDGCWLVSWELYYGTWFGQGAVCPDGLFEKETAPILEQLTFDSCQQSSVEYNATCNRAMDGSTNQVFSVGSCSHTDLTNWNWWRASLARRALIERVALFNRQDCCSVRLNNFNISLDGFVFASYFEAGVFSAKNFSCGRVGQMVQVDQFYAGRALTLCEVIAYGWQLS